MTEAWEVPSAKVQFSRCFQSIHAQPRAEGSLATRLQISEWPGSGKVKGWHARLVSHADQADIASPAEGQCVERPAFPTFQECRVMTCILHPPLMVPRSQRGEPWRLHAFFAMYRDMLSKGCGCLPWWNSWPVVVAAKPCSSHRRQACSRIT